MAYKRNPFDFVPFSSEPLLFNREELEKNTVSGYMELKITALTPVHILGKQDRDRNYKRIFKNHFFQQNGQCCIPGSSIRGMLRSFCEALTNGWVSQASEEYAKEKGKRHIGFKSFDKYKNKSRNITRTIDPAIPKPYHPFSSGNNVIDIGSYIFGYVKQNPQENDPHPSWKGKIFVEDAMLDRQDLQEFTLLDIDNAFMGGAKPSKSNWWYFTPGYVVQRVIPNRKRNNAEFIGDHYRGRKFYYHQDPKRCIDWYQDRRNWQQRTFEYKVESLSPQKNTEPFRIYFERLPERLLSLLLALLFPGEMRHKIGYGKAFGYGSMEFSVSSFKYRQDKVGVPDLLQDQAHEPGNILQVNELWNNDYLRQIKIHDFICQSSVKHLTKILKWNPELPTIYSYPNYRNGFQTTVTFQQYMNRASNEQIAQQTFKEKKTIDFDLYQKRASDN